MNAPDTGPELRAHAGSGGGARGESEGRAWGQEVVGQRGHLLAVRTAAEAVRGAPGALGRALEAHVNGQEDGVDAHHDAGHGAGYLGVGAETLRMRCSCTCLCVSDAAPVLVAVSAR